MGITTTDLPLLRLMQLSSASLPVGAYSFSQGLEYAVESNWVTTAELTAEWIQVVMHRSIATTDLALLIRLFDSLENDDHIATAYWNAHVIACRETEELILTETAMGEALFRLFRHINISCPDTIAQLNEAKTFILGFALAAQHWQLDRQMMLVGYLWSWLENQVAAAVKLVPLGQSTAQQLLIQLGEEVSAVIDLALQVNDEQVGASLPGLAMASAWHETQYSRLFRS